MPSKLYTDHDFWPKVKLDMLVFAWFHVIIVCPFLNRARVMDLLPIFKTLAKRNVTVCLFMKRPKNMTQSQLEEYEYLQGILRAAKVHVIEREHIHAKIVVIDFVIHWEGSLNTASQIARKSTTSDAVEPIRGPKQKKSLLSELEEYREDDSRLPAENMRRFFSETKELLNVIARFQLRRCKQCRTNALYYSVCSGPTPSSTLGLLVAHQRQKFRLDQTEIAQLIGTKSPNVSRIEAGHNITLKTLFKLAEKLDLDVALIPKHMTPSAYAFLKQQESNRSAETMNRDVS